jgi:hypothetical protein
VKEETFVISVKNYIIILLTHTVLIALGACSKAEAPYTLIIG